MRILHIGKYYPPHFGGIERVNFDLVEGLNQMDIQTDVLCFNDKPENLIEENTYKIYRSSTLIKLKSTPFSISMFFILKKIHRNYDIIHLHLPNPTGAIVLQLVRFKGKIVLHWHSDIIKQVYLKRIYSPLQKALLNKADRIIVTSPPYLEGSTDLKYYKSKCTIIPIGIKNAEATDANVLNTLKKSYQNKRVIFSLGRLTYYKGFHYLIDAAKELPDDFLIIIGGSGELYQSLRSKILEQKLENKVILTGNIPTKEIPAYYELCDLFCMPSCERSEAFGIVQLEAMAFAKPIISTDIPYSGVSWINQHQITGLVIPPKNSKALADAIKAVISNPELAERFGKNARERYISHFTSLKMIKKTMELYQSL